MTIVVPPMHQAVPTAAYAMPTSDYQVRGRIMMIMCATVE